MSFTIEQCVHVAGLYDGTAEDYDLGEVTTRHLWVADCWRTMAHWLVDHPKATRDEQSAQWDVICDRPEGDRHKVFGGMTLLEV